jgi:hypothetical protein
LCCSCAVRRSSPNNKSVLSLFGPLIDETRRFAMMRIGSGDGIEGASDE